MPEKIEDKWTQEDESNFLSDEEIRSIHLWISQMGQYLFHTPGKKVKIAQKTLKINYPLLGKGVNRMVFDLKNGYVLKITLGIWSYE